jgi:sugar transferase (PEP-CTERM system associated)
VIRFLHVYYPVRVVALFCGESLVVFACFLAAVFLRFGQDSYIVLYFEGGLLKIIGVTALAILSGHYYDLYSSTMVRSKPETYFRLLVMLGTVSVVTGILAAIQPDFIVGRQTYVIGIAFLAVGLLVWRWIFSLLIQNPHFRDRVYILGSGEHARTIADAIRGNSGLAIDLVGWSGALGDTMLTSEELGARLDAVLQTGNVDRIVVAMSERRGRLPYRALLQARLRGIQVEHGTVLLEQITGRIEPDSLHPSALIFAEGLNLRRGAVFVRAAVSRLIALVTLIVVLPTLPFVVAAIKLTSPGPVIYRQKRVGQNGQIYEVLKFRTMGLDAEANGAQWAVEGDPRVTKVGRFLRLTRIDEIPQLWNVLKGDMRFVGPRPERPEFVKMLAEQIPYYQLRHVVPPGITGWAQVRYRYGATVEDAKRKLTYDLYYIKHASLALDLLIVFETLKTVILRRGSQ